jgi:hypothetical protein
MTNALRERTRERGGESQDPPPRHVIEMLIFVAGVPSGAAQPC